MTGGGFWARSFILAPWPWTIFVIMPVNRQLKATAARCRAERHAGIGRHWGRLHGVRSAFGIAATLVYLWAAA
jgi:hypothetical protein